MRMRPFHLSALSAFAVSLAGCGDAYAQTSVRSASSGAVQASTQAENRKAKNVILFIGDGMGVSTVTAMRIYAGQKRGMSGEEYVLPFEKFDHVALVKTYNVDAQVPDSAGTATAMHSGQKTNIGYLGIGPGAARANCEDSKKHHLPLLGEEAKKRGLAVGIVSTARITHATPASVYARTTERGWETDAWIEESQRGLGCRDIARQLIDFDFDVEQSCPFFLSGLWCDACQLTGDLRARQCADLESRDDTRLELADIDLVDCPAKDQIAHVGDGCQLGSGLKRSERYHRISRVDIAYQDDASGWGPDH